MLNSRLQTAENEWEDQSQSTQPARNFVINRKLVVIRMCDQQIIWVNSTSANHCTVIELSGHTDINKEIMNKLTTWLFILSWCQDKKYLAQ